MPTWEDEIRPPHPAEAEVRRLRARVRELEAEVARLESRPCCGHEAARRWAAESQAAWDAQVAEAAAVPADRVVPVDMDELLGDPDRD